MAFTMEAPSTIIITLPSAVRDKVPIPQQAHRYNSSIVDLRTSSDDEKGHSKTRKRRIENLSEQEKNLRKKMKNRVAAQTSRDKKKALMDELEMQLQKARQQQARLEAECQRLRLENKSLRCENTELRERHQCSCSAPEIAVAQSPSHSIASRGTQEVGPAASPNRDPLQKGRDPRLAMAWQAWCCALGLLLLTSVNQQSQKEKEVSATLCSQHLPALPAPLRSSSMALTARRKWWGPQQSTWNPVEMS